MQSPESVLNLLLQEIGTKTLFNELSVVWLTLAAGTEVRRVVGAANDTVLICNKSLKSHFTAKKLKVSEDAHRKKKILRYVMKIFAHYMNQ